jgi:subtilase family serine protease
MATTIRRGAVLGTTAAMTLALAGLTPALAQAAGSSPRATLDGAPAWTAHAARVGQTPAARSQHLTAVLGLRDAAGAESLAASVSDPASAAYGRFVPAAAWRARFAPRSSDVTRVTDWLRAGGFTIGAIPANHRTISFSGSTAQVEKAFATDVQTFRKSGSTVTANAASVSVPRSLAGTVVGITGLDTSALRTPAHTGGPASSRQATAAAAPASAATPADTLPPPGPVFRNATPCSAYYGQKAATSVPQILKDPLTYAPCGYKPAQIRGAYGVDDALAAGYDGRGATIAILDAFASPTILSDAQTYARRNDPRHPLRRHQFAQSPPAGTARRPWTWMPRTPRRPRPTSCTSEPPAVRTPTSTPR